MRININKTTKALFRTEGLAFNNKRAQFYINVNDLSIIEVEEEETKE